MQSIYLDNNATTRPDSDVLDHVRALSEECFGNPGSAHQVGRRARQILEEARESVARSLNASPDGVVFTSGATESNNLALYGLARSVGTVAATEGEHPATEEVLRDLELRGWSRRHLKLDRDGRLAVASKDFDGVNLLSLIYAHNETGVVQSIEQVAEACLTNRIPWHLDATQAVGKIKVDFQTLGCTALSFAAHKFHGPRGIGCLVLQPGVTLVPRSLGGFQEGGRRAGTEPAALAAGLAMALERATNELHARSVAMTTLRDRFETQICQAIPEAIVHGQAAQRLPNTSCIGFPGRDGQALLVALDLAGVCCSLGSACASGSPEPAPVLLAMGVDEALARASLRFSLSHETTQGEIDEAIIRVVQAVEHQRR